MTAYRNAAYWWRVHHDETHDSDDEYTGKTTLSKHAFIMAELCEEAGLYDENDERSDYDDYPSDYGNEEEWEEPQYDYDDYDDYNPNDDDYYPDDYDPDGPHGPSGGNGNGNNDYYGPDGVHRPPEPNYQEWNAFEGFLEERYGSATDTHNLMLFYMELSDERNFRNVHKYYMSWVHREIIHRHILSKSEPIDVYNIFPFQSKQTQQTKQFKQTKTFKLEVSYKVGNLVQKAGEYVSYSLSDKSTDLDENYDNSNFDHDYDQSYDYDSDLTEQYTPIKSNKPKTPSKSLRNRGRNFRKADFANIIDNNIFALPVSVD